MKQFLATTTFAALLAFASTASAGDTPGLNGADMPTTIKATGNFGDTPGLNGGDTVAGAGGNFGDTPGLNGGDMLTWLLCMVGFGCEQ
ncbi:MAG: hypothetical protein IPG63_17470 [Xanthomonadales bacterium]|nr:hypothetical protein [Xanthomonadales bacterium]MBK7146172.1 hypothetical protein [Xanthomonadales bacterium]MCC6560785.1 hypothetical protein [Xanthomonadales bacterium]